MHSGAGEPGKRILPCQAEQAKEEINDLEEGHGSHGAVEVGGEEVPEDLRPEKALERGGDLVWSELY